MTDLSTVTGDVIQLTQQGLVLRAGEEGLDALRAEFGRIHCLRLPQFIEPSLLALLQRSIEHAEFSDRSMEGVGAEQLMQGNGVSGVLNFMLHEPRFLRLVERLTGCSGIGCFEGRVYRMTGGHYDAWHGDIGDDRILGLSVNLSAGVFSGGAFQLRKFWDGPILCDISNTGFGDAILFRISPELFHCVTPMEGSVPKTAFAGWFKSRPPDHPLLRVYAKAEAE